MCVCVLLFIENITRKDVFTSGFWARFITYITLALSLRPRKDKQLSNFTDKLFVYMEARYKCNPIFYIISLKHPAFIMGQRSCRVYHVFWCVAVEVIRFLFYDGTEMFRRIIVSA